MAESSCETDAATAESSVELYAQLTKLRADMKEMQSQMAEKDTVIDILRNTQTELLALQSERESIKVRQEAEAEMYKTKRRSQNRRIIESLQIANGYLEISDGLTDSYALFSVVDKLQLLILSARIAVTNILGESLADIGLETDAESYNLHQAIEAFYQKSVKLMARLRYIAMAIPSGQMTD